MPNSKQVVMQSGTPLKVGNWAELVRVAEMDAEVELVLDVDSVLDPLLLVLSSDVLVLALEAPQTNEKDWRKMSRDNGSELAGTSMADSDRNSKE